MLHDLSVGLICLVKEHKIRFRVQNLTVLTSKLELVTADILPSPVLQSKEQH